MRIQQEKKDAKERVLKERDRREEVEEEEARERMVEAERRLMKEQKQERQEDEKKKWIVALLLVRKKLAVHKQTKKRMMKTKMTDKRKENNEKRKKEKPKKETQTDKRRIHRLIFEFSIAPGQSFGISSKQLFILLSFFSLVLLHFCLFSLLFFFCFPLLLFSSLFLKAETMKKNASDFPSQFLAFLQHNGIDLSLYQHAFSLPRYFRHEFPVLFPFFFRLTLVRCRLFFKNQSTQPNLSCRTRTATSVQRSASHVRPLSMFPTSFLSLSLMTQLLQHAFPSFIGWMAKYFSLGQMLGGRDRSVRKR